jgi:predicted nucleic acid-binding protein
LILDADVVIDLLRNHGGATTWLSGVVKPPTISGVAALEVLYGARDSTELRRTEKFLARFPIEWPTLADVQSMRIFAPLRLSHGIGILDALTAALALRLGESVATFNTKHFNAVPGVRTFQPYVQ